MPKKRRKKPSIPCSTAPRKTPTYRSVVADLEIHSPTESVLVPLSSIQNDRNLTQKSCPSTNLAQTLRPSLSRSGSGFDESWELIGDEEEEQEDETNFCYTTAGDEGNGIDPFSNGVISGNRGARDCGDHIFGQLQTPSSGVSITNSATKKNTINTIRNLLEKKFHKKTNSKNLRVKLGSSTSSTASGYSSSLGVSPVCSSPNDSFKCFENKSFVRRLCQDREDEQLLDKVQLDQKLPWIEVSNVMFVEIGHDVLTGGTKDDLVDLIDKAEADGIGDFVVFFNRKRSDLKLLCKNLNFIGFSPVEKNKVDQMVKSVKVSDGNFYMNYALEGNDEVDLINFSD